MASIGEIKIFLLFSAVIVVLFLMMGNLSGKKPAAVPAASPQGYYHGLPDYMVHPEQANSMVKKLSVQVQGDYNLLTPDQKTWLDGMASGYGRQVLLTYYEASLKKSEKKRASTSAKNHSKN